MYTHLCEHMFVVQKIVKAYKAKAHFIFQSFMNLERLKILVLNTKSEGYWKLCQVFKYCE